MSGASFSAVGIFSSPELAKSAAMVLDDTLRAIADWHNNHSEKSKRIVDEWPGVKPIITPIEESLSQKYGVEWGLPVLLGYAYELSTYSNFLFLRSTGHTYTGAYPLDVFIERLGGTVLVSGDYINEPTWGELKIEVICRAPNEQDAQEIVAMFKGSSEFVMVTIEIEELFDGKSIKRFSQSIPEIMDYIKSKGCHNIVVISNQRRNYYVNWDK